MGVPTTTTLTFEEFERLPDHTGKRELVKGEVIELPPAKIKHARTSTGIYDRLKVALKRAHRRRQAAALGEVCIETGYYLKPDGWLIPDVSVTHAGQSEHEYLEGSPAIAIEVVSAGNTADQMDAKLDLYFEHGVIEVWLIYPKTRKGYIYVGGQGRMVRESEPITTSLLPGFSLILPRRALIFSENAAQVILNRMGVLTTTTLTFEEFERLPDHTGKRELVKGEVIELPPAKYRHNRTGLKIYKRLNAELEQARSLGQAAALGEAQHGMGYYLKPDGWLIPDASITHAGQVVNAGDYLEGAPAIAIEVVSPGNSAEQMAAKIALYFEHGAIEVWLIYPKLRQAHIYVDGHGRVVRESEPITTSLLPGFSLTLQDVL